MLLRVPGAGKGSGWAPGRRPLQLSQRLGLMPGASERMPAGLCSCSQAWSLVLRLFKYGLAISGAAATKAGSHSSTG